MKRKGASPVIAALLLIGIAVAGAVITYTWVMSMVKTQGAAAQTAIRLDEVLFGNYTEDDQYAGNYSVKVTIRNTGSVPTVIESVYVYKGDAQIATITNVDFALGEKDVAAITLEQAGSGATWANYSPDMGTEPGTSNVPGERNTGITTWSRALQTASGYLIRVVSDGGFTVEGTYYSPSNLAG